MNKTLHRRETVPMEKWLIEAASEPHRTRCWARTSERTSIRRNSRSLIVNKPNFFLPNHIREG